MKKTQLSDLDNANAVHGHDNSVKSIRKAVRILSILSENAFGLRLGEIADRLEIPKPSAHRILTTLQDVNYVRYEPLNRCWQINSEARTPRWTTHKANIP